MMFRNPLPLQERESLETKLQTLTTERDTLLSRYTEMESDLDSMMLEHAQQVESLTATLNQLSSSSSADGDAAARLQELNRELAVARDALSAAEETIRETELRLANQVSEADAHVKELEQEIEDAMFECDEMQGKMEQLESALQKAGEVEVELKEQIRVLEGSLQEGSRQDSGVVAELEEQLMAVSEERDVLGERVEALEGRVKELSLSPPEAGEGADPAVLEEAHTQIATLQAELERMRNEQTNGFEAEDLRVEFQKIVKERDDALAEVGVLKADVQELEVLFEEAQAEVEGLRKDKAAVPVQGSPEDAEVIAKLEQELDDALNEIDELREQLEVSSKTVGESNGPNPDDLKELIVLKQSLAEATDEIADLKTQLDDSSATTRGPRVATPSANDASNTQELEFMLEDAKFEIEELVAKLDESNATIDELEKLLEEEKTHADTFNTTNQSLTTEITTLHERLARQMQLSSTDGDTQSIISTLESTITTLKTDLEAQQKALMQMEEQFNESENVNKELNHSLDLADQEIENLNKELDEMFEANQQQSGAGGGAELVQAKARLEALEKELEVKNGELNAAVETRMQETMAEFSQREEELTARIGVLEEQAHGATDSLVQQLQDQQLDAQEMRETLVDRLRQQESEATALRDEIVVLKAEAADTIAKLASIQHDYGEFRTRAQALEKRYLERMDLMEDMFDQTCGEVETVRAQLVDCITAQGGEVPTFKPLPQLPPVNFDPPTSPTPSGEKKTFLSSVFGNRKPSGDKPQPAAASRATTPATLDEGGQPVSGTKSGQEESSSADSKSLKNKPSQGILRSIWGGNKNAAAAPTGSAEPTAHSSAVSPVAPQPAPLQLPATAIPANAMGSPMTEDEGPKQPPSTFLTSIWGAKSNLKRTNSSGKLEE
ncbi:hypothetical protein HDU98_001112 [Podochytrium sp. JEL0797]|nr:hypothetical protein HDU98_001112 [Podochytrium sp. JEL0797]